MAASDDIQEPNDTERDRALAQIKKRRDFGAHLVTFVVVNLAVWLLWAATGSGYPWPAWLTGFWAIGLVLNAWDVYLRTPITEDEIRREIDRRRQRHEVTR
jgi:hypothetical protein